MQENFRLEGLEERKAKLAPILFDAAKAGLVGAENTEKLATYLSSRGVDVPSPAMIGGLDGLDTPLAEDPRQIVTESEAPRLLRGFHDILISIGIMAGLGGLWGLGTVFLVLPAIIILAEILVRRQKLALPAFVLTIWLCVAVFFGALPIFDAPSFSEPLRPLLVVALLAAALALFYWRYRIPVAFAGLAAGLAGLLAIALWALLGIATGTADPTTAYPFLGPVLLGVFALIVFSIALRLDFGDPQRLTRRSDAAFWLHLVAAPALLYTCVTAIFIQSTGGAFSQDASLLQAFAVLAAVAALMLVGLCLDRRAFVTSGLISLGYALGLVAKSGTLAERLLSGDTLFFAILLIIGVLVLGLGTGWLFLRRHLVPALPQGLQRRVPPGR